MTIETLGCATCPFLEDRGVVFICNAQHNLQIQYDQDLSKIITPDNCPLRSGPITVELA